MAQGKRRFLCLSAVALLSVACGAYGVEVRVEPAWAQANVHATVSSSYIHTPGWAFDPGQTTTASDTGADAANAGTTALLVGHRVPDGGDQSWPCTVNASVSATVDGFSSSLSWIDKTLPTDYGNDSSTGWAQIVLTGSLVIGSDADHPAGTPLDFQVLARGLANWDDFNAVRNLTVNGQIVTLSPYLFSPDSFRAVGDLLVCAGTSYPFTFEDSTQFGELLLNQEQWDVGFALAPEPCSAALLTLAGLACLKRRPR